jgi:WD40 repeat protein/tetratricopeptide (TPR) repeat protein
MPALTRTIRLFVSSTFSDMKAERDALQSDVFPKLRQLCLSNGLRFQAIDLRWGVPEEAGKDNRTMRICLRELKRCQEARPKPNFLILLGDRYGWQPLPEIIPADLFAQLRERLAPAMKQLFEWRDSPSPDAKGWYRRDDNAVPPVYELRPRGEDERWYEAVEQPLLHALEAAARMIGLNAETHGVTIGTSATEQEIVEGALKVDDAGGHVHAFFRSISGLPHDPWPADFVDVASDGTRDPVATARLDDLKTQIEAKLGTTNIHGYTVPWREGGVQPTDLTQFGADVYAALKEVVLRQIGELTATSREAQEEQAHRAFGDDRCRGFIGRTKALERAAAYLRGSNRGMLAVVGPSGSGKSAAMAEAVRRARVSYGEGAVIARFIGATPESANVLSLVSNLLTEIRRRYPAPPPSAGGQPKDGPIPIGIDALTAAFHEALSRPNDERPLFVFLDALDQLAPGDGALECRWLPGALNPHVRLILSAALPSATDAMSDSLPGEPFLSSRDPRAIVIATLERRSSEIDLVRLEPLSADDGRALITQWLADAGRTLQHGQHEAVLGEFANEGNPLWLRVAMGECQCLASWDSPPVFNSGLPGLLLQVLKHLSAEDEHGSVLVERTLAAIASARHGLAEDELMDVLSADQVVLAEFRRRSPKSPPNDTLPTAVWVRLYGDIAPYLAERQLQNAALLGFYHRAFLEAVHAAFLDSDDKQRIAHQRLVDYFGGRTWFIAPVDEQGRVQREATITDPPNARKASELPWQLLQLASASDPVRKKLAVWDAPVAVLCDIQCLEARSRAGLVFELQEDYRAVKNALPEAQMMLREDQQRTSRIARWTDEVISYSTAWSERRCRIERGQPFDEAEPMLPEIPPAVRFWTDEEIEAERRRIREVSTRLDRLTTFAGFVESECHLLLEFGGREGYTLQQAMNYAPGGPVHNAASGLLPRCAAPLLIRRWPKEATWNAKPAMLRTLEGPDEDVTSVSVTPDARRAVSGGKDKTVRVWDLESGACLRTLEGHRGSVTSISVTPDGRHAVSGSEDHTVRLWDLENGACLRILDGGSVDSVSVTPDGRRAVSGGKDKTLRVWDLESGSCLRELEGHSEFVTSVSVTSDGRRAMSGSWDETLRVWDLESGACLCALEAHHSVHCLSVTPDGRRAVSGGADNRLRVWDLETGACLREMKAHLFESVSITADGRRAVSAGGDVLCVWDLEAEACLRTLEGHDSEITSVTITADGRRAVSGSRDQTLRVWDLESGSCLRPPGHDALVYVVSIAPDGGCTVSGSRDQTLRVWDSGTAACVHVLKGHTWSVECVAVTPDGRRAVSGSMDSTLRVWDLKSGTCLHTLKGHRQDVTRVCVTPDGRRALSASQEDTPHPLRLWDLESGVCLATPRLEDFVFDIGLTPDGRRAVSALEKTLNICDLESGAVRMLEGHKDRIWSVRVTPDGRRAVSGSLDATVKVWDLESGACLHTLEGHSAGVWSVDVTPDGRRAVSGGEDATVRVWDLESGVCERTLLGRRESVFEVKVTPDGRRAAFRSGRRTFGLWDLETGVCLAVLNPASSVNTIAISPALIAVGTQAGEVLLMEMRNLPARSASAPDKSDAAYEGLLRRGLEHSRRLKGHEHQETLAHLAALAIHLARTGRYAGAELLVRQVLETRERVLGREHPDTLSSMNNLASLLTKKGDYAGPEQMSRQAVEVCERVLGPEHPDALSSMSNLASSFKERGNYEAAEPMFRNVLRNSERTLGPEHPATLENMNNLANLLEYKGDFEAAEPLYRRALKVRERVLGVEHRDTLISVNNLASLLGKMGDYPQAESLQLRALEAQERTLGAEDPLTLGSANNLACVLHSKGDLENAEPLFQRALEGRMRVLGPEHPDTLTSLDNLGGLLKDKGDYPQAEQLRRRALNGFEKILGPDHPDTLTSVSNLAALLCSKGDYALAEPLYRRALKTTERVLGPEHPDTITRMRCLARLLLIQGQNLEAESLYRRVLEICEHALPSNHPDTLNALDNLAGLLYSKGDYAAAEPLCRRALEGRERVLGPQHLDTLMSANSLATMLFFQGNYVAAEPLYRRAVSGALAVNQSFEQNPHLKTLCDNYINCLIKLGLNKSQISDKIRDVLMVVPRA